MKTFWRVGLSGALVSTVMACSGGAVVCDKSDALDLSTKAGDCSGLTLDKPFGAKSACLDKVKACSSSEQDSLSSMVVCLGNLQVCSATKQKAFIDGYNACFASATALSSGCRTSVFGAVVPGEDGGLDAGRAVDAGRQPIVDGGEGVDLIAVADETGFAFAWSARQPATVAKWELNVFDATTDGGRLASLSVSGAQRALDLADAGSMVSRQYFLAGVDNNGVQVFGEAPDGGVTASDAGLSCVVPIDCPPNRVCDLGQCVPQTCQPGGAMTCPPGYDCLTSDKLCNRQFSDAGTIDAGVVDAGVFRSLPMLSAPVLVTTGTPGISPEVPVGGFAARRPDLVAIDSARQFISLEQLNQPFGHFTARRGKELINDLGTTAPIDTVGSRVKLAYVPQSDTVFACYGVGRGIRVRASRDLGKSWGSNAATLTPEDDGGFSSRFSECSIAPWRNGGAILTYIEDDSIVVRTVSETLAVSEPPEYVFFSSPTDGGGDNIYQPNHTAIATLPGDLADGGVGAIVHIGFTGTRLIGSGADTEIYDLYRDGTTSTFRPPTLLNRSATGGSGLPQDYVSIAVDPKSGRAVAAYGSIEPGAASSYNTIYVSLFSPATKSWITGSDLTVFAKDSTGTQFYLFPARSAADTWDAFSPSLAVTRAGKIFLSVVAGKRAGGGSDLRMYLVGFDFNKQSPIGGLGWFLPPAVKLSETRVFDPRPSQNVVPIPVSAITADTQLSIYGVFIEGIGLNGDTENRAVYVSRP